MADGDPDNQPIVPVPIEPTQPPEIPKEVDKGGQPTVMTEVTIKKLRDAFMFGATDAQACAFAGISRQTLYNYQTQHPGFVDQKEEWKENPILRAKVTVYNKLNDIDTARWYLERKAKDEFAARGEITGAGGEDLIPRLLDKIEKTKYDERVREAKKQVVATQQPVQGQEQIGGAGDISAEPAPTPAPAGEAQPPAQPDPQG